MMAMKNDPDFSAPQWERRALPEDGAAGTLIGRAWVPASKDNPVAGPAVVVVREDGVYDISRTIATMADLINAADPLALIKGAGGAVRLGSVGELLANSFPKSCDAAKPFLLAPIDLQSVKAAGVTFAASLVERVIEERAKGDPAKAEAIRADFSTRIGTDLSTVRPGSETAQRLKEALVQEGLWSQYLEVGIGPDAEVFTKCQPMASVGFGADVGVRSDSTWNNPEPEIVLVVDARGRCLGASLGNDVNLRDFEGRSALLLGKAKDNTASCAVGPFIRLFDATFTLDDVRACDVTLEIEGPDGFKLNGVSSVSKISRDLLDLVSQTIGASHQYPDGFVLFIGTMFAPTRDREAPGKGFTHKVGDVVGIASPKLGTLVNRVEHCEKVEPWTFGVSALMRNLMARGLL
jgi:fumarylacetoacetate (FAA) hydrolase family protein